MNPNDIYDERVVPKRLSDPRPPQPSLGMKLAAKFTWFPNHPPAPQGPHPPAAPVTPTSRECIPADGRLIPQGSHAQ